MLRDVLGAIRTSQGKPTRIMADANLSWLSLMTFLEVLLRNDFVQSETQGMRVVYTLTTKGEGLLRQFESLYQEILPLELGNLPAANVAIHDWSVKSKARRGPIISALRSNLEGRGFTLLENDSVAGRSGVVHRFDLLTEDPRRLKHGYLVVDELDSHKLLGLFVNQLDSGVTIHVIPLRESTPEDRRLAKKYGIDIRESQPTDSRPI